MGESSEFKLINDGFIVIRLYEDRLSEPLVIRYRTGSDVGTVSYDMSELVLEEE